MCYGSFLIFSQLSNVCMLVLNKEKINIQWKQFVAHLCYFTHTYVVRSVGLVTMSSQVKQVLTTVL